MQKTEGNAVFFHRYVKMYMLGCKSWYSLVFVLDVEPIKTVGFPFSPDLQDFKYVDTDLVYLFACSASSVIKTCQSQAHQRTQRWARHPVLQPWMLNQLPTFGFHEKKKKSSRKWSFASLPTCQVKPLTDKMNAVKPWHDGRFCAHMPKCVRSSSTHLSFNNATGCHLAFTRTGWWEGDMVPFPSRFPQNRHQVLCPPWQQWVFLVMTHCQKATQSSNLPRYLPSKF